MDFSLSKQEEGFRDERRAWLAVNLPITGGCIPRRTMSCRCIRTSRSMPVACGTSGCTPAVWGDHPRAPEGGRWAFQALFANRFGIAGGTDQIQRSIIGERLLGLPK